MLPSAPVGLIKSEGAGCKGGGNAVLVGPPRMLLLGVRSDGCVLVPFVPWKAAENMADTGGAVREGESVWGESVSVWKVVGMEGVT